MLGTQKEREALENGSIESEGTYKRLWVYARNLARAVPDVFDGISADDLVNETMLAFLKSPDGLGWQPDRTDLSVFLCGVLRHKFLDHLKRHRRIAGSVEDQPLKDIVEAKSAAGVNILKQLEVSQWMASLIEKLSPHKDLQQVVAAAEGTDGSHNTNQQIAETLRTTPGDIANRRKRIFRILFGKTK